MKGVSKKYITVLMCCFLFVACTAFGAGALEECGHNNTVDFKRSEPTCVTVGYTEGLYCIDCSSFVSGHEEIPFIDHLQELHEGVDATCTESGYTDGVYCSMCKNWISGHEVIPAGHKEAVLPKVPETCTTDGCTEGVYCTVCGEILSGVERIPAAHKEVYVPEEPATCTGNGYTAGLYCTVCNEYFWGHAEIPFTEHIFSEKIIDERHLVRPATYESPAVYRYDCATCSAISPTLTFTDGERLPIGATRAIKVVQNAVAIKLDWASVPGASGYRIYHYVNGKGWRAVRDVNGTTTTFTGLVSGTVYKLAVRAFVYDSGRIILSHDYTTIETATKTLAPQKIASQQNTSAIRLMWTPVKNASGYRIYYKSGSSWKICVSSTVSTSHTFTKLPAGQSYQFAVRPYMMVSAGLIMGDYSTFVASTVPAVPKVAASSPAPKHISLAWAAVKTDYYQLYYKVNNGGYKLYKVYTAPQKLMFSNLTSSAKFTFVVRAVKKTSSGYIYGAYTPVSVTVR